MAEDRLAIEGGSPVRPEYLVFGSPDLSEVEVEEVVATIRSGWLGTGPRAARFQEAIRDRVGAEHALALNSCTAGLHLSLVVAGLGPGDEVVTTPMTFAASANVVVHTGATPVFADCQRDTMNLDPEAAAAAVTANTKAVLPVDMAGRPCDLDAFTALAAAEGLVVVEDAAHAFGAEYHGRAIGSIADFTAFSFYITKNLVTGEGGLVTMKDAEAARLMSMYSLHGMSRDAWARYSDAGYRHYLVEVPGFKYNMMDLQAAIGLVQLDRFDAMQARRNHVWDRYIAELADLPVFLPPPAEPDTVHARHLFTALLDIDELTVGRDEVLGALHQENIGTGVHFVAVHLHPYYRERFGFQRGAFPNAEWISDRTMSLPLSGKLTDDDIDDVVAAMRKVLHRYAR